MKILALLALTVLQVPKPDEAKPPAGSPPAAKLAEAWEADVRAVRNLVRRNWSYLQHRRERGEVDLAALERDALAILAADRSPRGFERALRRYAAGLCDGHAGVVVEGDGLPAPRRWPFTLADVREGVMIDGLADGTADGRASALLRRGDLLLEVDGTPVEQLIRGAERMVCASSPGARRAAAIRWIARWTDAERIRVRVRRPRAALVEPAVPAEQAIEVELACPRAHVDIARPAAAATDRQHRMLDEDVAYFRPGSFLWPVGSDWHGAAPERREEILADSYNELERIVAELSDAEAMVLDLRGNPGGTDLLGQALATMLIEPGFVYFQLQSKQLGFWGFTHAYRPKARSERRFRGKLCCLIDEGTFSTADNFAACLRDVHKDVRFVGRPTGAGTGAPRLFTLSGTGARIRFCTQRVYAPGGQMIEGIGVTPDVEVHWSRSDVLEGRDPDLEAALELLRG